MMENINIIAIHNFRTGATIWSKTLEAVPFRAYAMFPVFLPFLKWILVAVFCEDVQHRLGFSLDLLNCAKMTVSSIREQRNGAGGQIRRVGWVGEDSHVVFLSKIPW
jgi:hypothetical protein